jgi:hypothetical protein
MYCRYRVNHIQAVTGTFLMSMNLLNFPMDEHYLSVRVKAGVPSSAPKAHALRNSTVDTKSGLKFARLKPFRDLTPNSRANTFSMEYGFYCHWSCEFLRVE